MSVKSDVWKYFQKVTAEEATCTSCLSTIKCKGSSTSGMRNHLKVKHDIRLNQEENNTPKKTGENITPPLTHIKRDYLEETLSRLVAVDIISIRVLTNSEFIRKSLMERGLSMPENENSVMKLINNYFNKRKYELKEKLRKLNEKYSLTIDEWTGSKLRKGRFLRINLHDANNNWYNLGLLRSFDTMSPDIIVKHLNDFGLNFYTDIVACTSSEVIENLKFENEIYPETQLCINYAIHLAINDVLYGTGNTSDNENINEEDENISDDEWEEEFEVRYIKNVTYSMEAITRTLTAVRKIIFLFRKSTIEYIVLQEHIKKQFGKEMQLIMDDPTRWNTLDTMIERFLMLKEQIKTCLIKLQKPELYVDVNEILLSDLRQTLSPIKVAVDALNSKTANLLTAEAIILFLFDTLSKLDSKISVMVLNGLKERISERRNTKLSTLIKYLHNPLSITQQDQHDVIVYSAKPILINYTKELLDKMVNDETSTDTNSTDNDVIVVKQEKIDMETDANAEMTLKEQLEFAIKASLQQNTSTTNDATSIGTEFTMYEHTSMKTSNLDLLYKAVSTVRPTSTDIEHIFSLAGTYQPEYNLCLSDELLNAIVFLKYYFLQRDEI